MFFNSLDFAIFLPTVFILYWFVAQKHLRLQNVLIVIASYVFYGWWDWRFLFLILISTVIDYSVGLGLDRTEDSVRRKILLSISVIANIGFLGFFKYYNFFLENIVSTFSIFGIELQAASLQIVLPVGISFYTFQTLSYSIDVYRKKLNPTRDFIAFAAFVSFFPQLVAGPIERATHLLPQFGRQRKFDYALASDGMRQILWGLFKKIVIADNCAVFVNQFFNNSSDYSGSTLLLGAIFFAFQIYGDFSGYSDIAIGVAKLFGFTLMKNFAYPYFSRDIAEFWRRWHISLSTWFRDYLYIPLGGSRGGLRKNIRNTFIIFVVSGFWHGANWTFIVWGALNALYFLPLLLAKRNRRNLDTVAEGNMLPSIKELFSIAMTFGLTLIAWIFFRAENIPHALQIIGEIFSLSLFSIPDFNGKRKALQIIVLILLFIVIEWNGRTSEYGIERIGNKWNTGARWVSYYALAFAIYWFGYSGTSIEFIYFQF